MSAIDYNDDIETVLRGELSARADSVAAGPPPYAAVQRAVRHDRTRRLAGAVGGLALVAALAVTLMQVLGGAAGSALGSAAGAPSALLTIPTRGNLADDSAFVTAMKWRLDTATTDYIARPDDGPGLGKGKRTSGFSILYANDDGMHRVVIAGTYDGTYTYMTALVGAHADTAAELTLFGSAGTRATDESFTFLGEATTDGVPVPFVVLGPTRMTDVEYATGITLTAAGGRLALVRTQITQVDTVDGVAAGEIPGVMTAADAVRLETFTAFRAEIDGRHVDADPPGRSSPAPRGNLPSGPGYTAIKAAVAQQGRAAGLNMSTDSPGGDAVPDNVAQVLLDLAIFDGVPINTLTYQVDWIGRETGQWDAALLDVHAPGLPAMQIFVRGLTAGAPDGASPGLAKTLVRPARALTPGHLPHTGSEFGGTPEPPVFGYQVMTTW